jgi:polyisoprenoid-binding protein YceI
MVKDPWGNEKAGFTVNGKITRSDWGLNWNSVLETGGFLMSEEVEISCEIELTKIDAKAMKMDLILEEAVAN